VNFLRSGVRSCFDAAEAVLGRAFPPAWNPLLNLGALGFFFFWIITASGIYVYIFFDTGVESAYASVEYMTHDQWYAAGVMRSLHRYASDALVVVVLAHLAREFGHDRYRGVRWFSWVTGVPVLVMIFIAGITGYWLVWDKLAQYVAIVSSEWLDRLGIFGQPVAHNFLSVETLDSRFFSLMIFIHIAVPLIALLVLWIHLQRVTKPRINPPRGLAIGSLGAMLGLSLVHPAVSQGPADLSMVPGAVGLDWFYLPLYPLLETWPGPVTWSAAATLLVILLPFRGCRRCGGPARPWSISTTATAASGAITIAPIMRSPWCRAPTAWRSSSSRASMLPCAWHAAYAPGPARRRRRSVACPLWCRGSICPG
jgi:hypothetical protein